MERFHSVRAKPQADNPVLLEKETTPLQADALAADLLKRPQLTYWDVARMIGENPQIDENLAARVETEIKYEGYIKRQLSQIEALKKQENTIIPPDFSYAELSG